MNEPAKQKPISKHFNEHEAASLTGLSVKTLRRYRHEMRGPVFYKLGRRVLYAEPDLVAWIEARRVQTQTI